MGFFDAARHVVNKADIILLIIDARMPELARNRQIEHMIHKRGKILVLVFNKIDLVGQKNREALAREFPDAFFVAGIKNQGISKLRTGLIIMAKRERIDLPFIGVVGYPNVGKSAIINALAHGERTKVSSVAGTTKGYQYVKVGRLRIIDSPGVIPMGEKEGKLGFIGAKNPEKLKQPQLVAMEIIKTCLEKNNMALKKTYAVEVENKESYDILLDIAKKRGFLLKGGIMDEKRTALQIIRDWYTGKLRV